MKSYIPNITIDKYCEKVWLCSIRKSNNNSLKIWVKLLDWTIYEEDYSEIINKSKYLWKEIIRVYSSWHIFLNEKNNKVFLITTEKEWKIQNQFTWWSPLEKEYMDIFQFEEWVYKLNTKKTNQNARKRTETMKS